MIKQFIYIILVRLNKLYEVMRTKEYRSRLKHCGLNVCIGIGSDIPPPERLFIGNNTVLGRVQELLEFIERICWGAQ